MLGLFKSKVTVTFVNDSDDDVIAVFKMSAQDLPETFLESTTLEIGEASWSVVSADPPLRSEFAKTRKLTLRLLPIEELPPHDILFSLPSIEDTIPGSDGEPADGSEFVMREDDWRQIEFVCRDFAGEARQEIQSIVAIYEDAGEAVGFSEVHVRQRLPFPVGKVKLTLEDLDKAFGPNSPGIRFHDSGSRITGTVCHRLESGWVLYSQSGEDSIVSLGLVRNFEEEDAMQAGHIDSLGQIGEAFGLLLVDWCRCVIAEPNSDDFRSVFQSG